MSQQKTETGCSLQAMTFDLGEGGGEGSGGLRPGGGRFGDGGVADLIARLVLTPVHLCTVRRQTQIEPRTLT